MLNFKNLKPFSMKKHFLFIILLIIAGVQLLAQKSNDVLYLKNGSIIYGKLIEVIDDQYKMQTKDGSIFIFKSSEVEKFSKEPQFFEGRKDNGFGFSLESGLLIGSQHSEYPAPFSFNLLLSFTNSIKYITSLGSGVEFYGRPYTPVFVEYKYIFNNRMTSPFVFVRGGAVIALPDDEKISTSTYINNNTNNGPKDYKGGASITLGTGISWAKADYETYLSFAYRYARTSYVKNEYSLGDVTYKNTLNRLEIKFGYKF
jgi:hypothetical protein